jgi:hypothetical protein
MEKKEFESRARGDGRGVIELSERIYNPVDGPAWQLLKVKLIQSSCRERQRQTDRCIHTSPTSVISVIQIPAHGSAFIPGRTANSLPTASRNPR